MTEYLRGLLSHRDAARVAAGRPPLGPNRLRGAEILREHLSAGHASTAKAASTAALKLPKRRRIMRTDASSGPPSMNPALESGHAAP